jgi:hypothetical protein
VTPCGQAILLYLNGLPFGSMGLLNVYGPNKKIPRSDLWWSLSHMVDPNRTWLVGGDFNMSLYLTDQQGGQPSTLAGSEAATWREFSTSLGLTEYFLA